METSSRMRQCLRRNYKGCDHYGAAADHEDQVEKKLDQKNVMDPSGAPALTADAISMELVNEDDEQAEIDNVEGKTSNVDQSEENQSSLSGKAQQNMQVAAESGNMQFGSEQDLVQSSSAVAPGYVPSQVDERIVLELPSSMVRLLRVVRGTFQVRSRSYSAFHLHIWISYVFCLITLE